MSMETAEGLVETYRKEGVLGLMAWSVGDMEDMVFWPAEALASGGPGELGAASIDKLSTAAVIYVGAATADVLTASELPMFEVSWTRYPDLAENMWNAQMAGQPEVLTYRPDLIDINRAESGIRDLPRFPGLSPDEYPFACTAEGGCGAWIGHIPLEQQWAQGGLLSRFIQDYGIEPFGRFRVRIVW